MPANRKTIKRKKVDMIQIFAIILLIGGFISAFSPVQQLYLLSKARYRIQAYSDVLSIRIEKENKKIDPGHISSGTKVWITKEEFNIEGKIISYEGRYYEEPETSILHTLISSDGIHWSVNDANMKDLIAGMVAGTIISLSGILILFLKYKNIF